MPKRFARRSGRRPVGYRIVVRGEICEPLVGPLEGMVVEAAGEESTLAGDIIDQAHLQAVLNWLQDRGIEVVSVNPVRRRARR